MRLLGPERRSPLAGSSHAAAMQRAKLLQRHRVEIGSPVCPPLVPGPAQAYTVPQAPERGATDWQGHIAWPRGLQIGRKLHREDGGNATATLSTWLAVGPTDQDGEAVLGRAPLAHVPQLTLPIGGPADDLRLARHQEAGVLARSMALRTHCAPPRDLSLSDCAGVSRISTRSVCRWSAGTGGRPGGRFAGSVGDKVFSTVFLGVLDDVGIDKGLLRILGPVLRAVELLDDFAVHQVDGRVEIDSVVVDGDFHGDLLRLMGGLLGQTGLEALQLDHRDARCLLDQLDRRHRQARGRRVLDDCGIPGGADFGGACHQVNHASFGGIGTGLIVRYPVRVVSGAALVVGSAELVGGCCVLCDGGHLLLSVWCVDVVNVRQKRMQRKHYLYGRNVKLFATTGGQQ